MATASRVLPSISNRTDRLRNVCILAHVDHGKTSLADALLATNGIISPRQAGALRYMDSLEAEQIRGITMKSSAVALFYNPSMQLTRQISPEAAATDPNSYLINLIDSPGHVDFASDVSTAVRLCDCALIVVDAVEGVCPQTRVVLRQAWNEKLTLILVLNKIDRLFIQLGLTPLQVYERILRLLEQVNSVLAEMFAADVIQKRNDNSRRGDMISHVANGTYTWSTGLENTDDSHIYFSPDRANVIFASAVDGWGFRIEDFAKTWSEKMNLPSKGLLKALWGDYYFVPSPDGGPPRVKPHARSKNKKPVFVQLILNHLCHIYKTLILDEDRSKAEHIAEKIGVKLEARLLQNADNRLLLRSILGSWLPLGPALFRAIVEICPSPLNAISRVRACYMLFGESPGGTTYSEAACGLIEDNDISDTDGDGEVDEESTNFPAIRVLEKCDSKADAPVIIFVSKVFCSEKQNTVSKTRFPKEVSRGAAERQTGDTRSNVRPPRNVAFASRMSANRVRVPNESSQTPNNSVDPALNTEFVALSRIYSGQVKIGQRLFVLGPKFDGSNIPKSLLDADPADLPLGPLRIPETDADEDALSSSRESSGCASRQRMSSTSSCSSASSDASSNYEAPYGHGDSYVRHVYVGEVCDVVQFCGGQNNVIRLSGHQICITSFNAGNVVGLVGDSIVRYLPKSGLLISSLRLVTNPSPLADSVMTRRIHPLAGLAIWQGAPVVSLAIEPASAADPQDMDRLEKGLRLLERSDPCAELTISVRGEFLLHAAGEIHMQKCLEDLSKYFAPGVEFHTSPFVVPFRETVTQACPPAAYEPFDSLSFAKAELERELKQKHLVYDERLENCVRLASSVADEGFENEVAQRNQKQQNVTEVTDPTLYLPLGVLQLPHAKLHTRIFIRVTAHPIPENLLTWLETRGCAYIRVIMRSVKHGSASSRRALGNLKRFEQELATKIDQIPQEACSNLDWGSLKGRLLCLGPQQVGPNMLFSRLRSGLFRLDTAWGKPMPPWSDSFSEGISAAASSTTQMSFLSYGKALLRGFQMATERGPLCAEPMRGVAFVLEEIYAEDKMQLPKPRILTAGDVLEEEEKAQAERAATESENASEETKEDEEPEDQLDPIMAALRAKRAAIQKRQKADPISTMAWLNLDDDEERCSDEDDYIDDDDYWYSGDDKDSRQSESDDSSESGQHGIEFKDKIVEPEAKLTIRDHYYWKRRNDTSWLAELSAGLLTPAMTRACISAFMACPAQRLVLSMYDVELQCRGDALGRMYAVLRKRYGQVISEDLREGEECFLVQARLPVVESFDLTDDLRKSTAGLVTLPQLKPGGWEVLDINPLQRDANGKIAILGETHVKVWQRQQEAIKRLRLGTADGNNAQNGVANDGEATDSDSDSEVEEELAQDEIGTQVARVRAYLRDVRKRKGLSVNEQLVISGDKQRTLKKNK